MGDEAGYNGWRNFETWSTALIVDNDEALYRQRLELVAAVEVKPSESLTPVEARRYATAEALREWITGEVLEPTSDEPLSYLWTQLVDAALAAVDWAELAEAWLEELEEADAR